MKRGTTKDLVIQGPLGSSLIFVLCYFLLYFIKVIETVLGHTY